MWLASGSLGELASVSIYAHFKLHFVLIFSSTTNNFNNYISTVFDNSNGQMTTSNSSTIAKLVGGKMVK